MKRFAGNLGEILFLHGKWRLIEIFNVKILKYIAVRHVTEQRDLVLETLIERMLGTADDDIRLDTHSLQLFDARLCRLCLKLAGCLDIWNQCYMNEDCILVPYFVLELTDCLEERLALDVADGTADFNDGNVCLLGSKVPVEAALDLVCDVRDDLYGTSAEIAAALLLKNRPVYLTGCNVGILGQALVDETLIMS